MKRYFTTNSITRVFAVTTSLFMAAGLNTAVLAEGNSAGGDDFRQTAMEYEEKAEAMRDDDNSEVAAIYDRLAEIKYEAADLADEGRWDEIDWTEYEALNEQLWKK